MKDLLSLKEKIDEHEESIMKLFKEISKTIKWSSFIPVIGIITAAFISFFSLLYSDIKDTKDQVNDINVKTITELGKLNSDIKLLIIKIERQDENGYNKRDDTILAKVGNKVCKVDNANK